MSADPKKTLYMKLADARKAARAVEKRGKNTHQKYDYVRAADVVREAERVLQEQSVIILPSVDSVEETMGNGLMVQVRLAYEVIDAVTGERITKPWIGYGYDKPGDKAIYKAITGSNKYFLAGLLGIPFGADPEDEVNGGSTRGTTGAQAKRRDGQADGRSSQATPPQRRKMHSLASELHLGETQFRAWIQWNAGTIHTDRIEKQRASELIELLSSYDTAEDALADFKAALDANDDRAQKIAAQFSAGAAQSNGSQN